MLRHFGEARLLCRRKPISNFTTSSWKMGIILQQDMLGDSANNIAPLALDLLHPNHLGRLGGWGAC